MSDRLVVRVSGASKTYPTLTRRGRLHSFKGALLRGELFRRGSDQEGFQALHDADLELGQGETFAIIGPNGSGKSTLLKMVAGILRPTAGSVSVRGRVTALIELGAGFHPEITGRDNAIINGMMLGMSRAEVMEKLPEIIEFAGIGHFIDEPVKTYSSGMFVRLGFAVAVAPNPDVLIIDEILAVGDEAFAHRCLDRIAYLQRQGTAILFVSHDLRLVETLAQRAMYLREGRTVLSGLSRAVVARYRSDVATQEAGRPTQVAVGKRWGDRRITLEAVDLVDASGRVAQVIRSGESAAIRLAYGASERQDDFVFGVALHRADGTHVFGTNTEIDGWTPQEIAGEGEIRIEFPTLELAPGHYLVHAAVHSRKGLAYDYLEEALAFLVTAPIGWPGSYAPAHRWVPAGPSMQPPSG